MRQSLVWLLSFGLLLAQSLALAKPPLAPPPTVKRIEAGFSPEGSGERLILRVLAGAQRSIRLAGYTFTSPRVAEALVQAHKRGVEVAVMVDHNNNLAAARGPLNKRSLDVMARAGVAVRTVKTYALLHDKFIIADERHVEIGSYNFTASAARRNSESLVVIWNDPALARQFLTHWRARWEKGIAYQPGTRANK